jgi:lipopolysaccharide biosynthesis regulator YciM
MATPGAVLLVGLVALLLGLAAGKAWERYKLQDGVWIDRRRARESPHYMLGLNFLVANQIDQAIDELTKAARAAGDPLEIHLILGNLYREKGQIGRAIQEHQALLQRPNLRKLEHANVLLCIGLDYRSGGFVDRAIEAFTEVLKLDPENRYALSNLEKLYEDQHQWTEAYAARQKLAALATGGEGGAESPKHNEVLAFRSRHRPGCP